MNNNNKNIAAEPMTPIHLTKADLPMAFEMSRDYRKAILWSIGLSAGLSLLMVGLTISDLLAPAPAATGGDLHCGGGASAATQATSSVTGNLMNAALILFWLSVAGWMTREYRNIKNKAITLCAEGLYYTEALPDAAFVHWDEIQSIHDRPYLHRMDLLGEKGLTLISLHYQLNDYNRVIDFVTKNVSLSDVIDSEWLGEPSKNGSAKIFERNPFYMAFTLLVIAAFAMGGFLWPGDVNGFGVICGLFVAALCSHEFIQTIHSLSVWRDHIVVSYPLKKIALTREDILDVRLVSGGVGSGQFRTEIIIDLTADRPSLVLYGLHESPADLASSIRRWVASRDPLVNTFLRMEPA